MPDWLRSLTDSQQFAAAMIALAIAMVAYKAIATIYYRRASIRMNSQEDRERAHEALLGWTFWVFLAVIAIAATVVFDI